jgi:hypothetical protein
VLPPEQVAELVHEVASVPATAAQMAQVIGLLRDIRDEESAERVDRELEDTPYSGLRRILHDHRVEMIAWLGLILVILQMVQAQLLADREPTAPIDEQRIIREIEEHIDQRLDEKESDDNPSPREHC